MQHGTSSSSTRAGCKSSAAPRTCKGTASEWLLVAARLPWPHSPSMQFVTGTKTGKSGPAGFPSLDTIKSTGEKCNKGSACVQRRRAPRETTSVPAGADTTCAAWNVQRRMAGSCCAGAWCQAFGSDCWLHRGCLFPASPHTLQRSCARLGSTCLAWHPGKRASSCSSRQASLTAARSARPACSRANRQAGRHSPPSFPFAAVCPPPSSLNPGGPDSCRDWLRSFRGSD